MAAADSEIFQPKDDAGPTRQANDRPTIEMDYTIEDLAAAAPGRLGNAQQVVSTEFGGAVFSDSEADGFTRLSFSKDQRVQLRADETGDELHERLRPLVLARTEPVSIPTIIDTPVNYTFDASKVLGIENAVVVSTSGCKHELPISLFVGIRSDSPWHSSSREPGGERTNMFRLRPLGRELSDAEKNAIYDSM